MRVYTRFSSILMLAAVFLFAACGGGDRESADNTVVNIASIAGVTPPSYGATPVKSITETAQYTGTVSWSGLPASFATDTVYTATITLTAKSGYTLTGVTANFFTIAGATATNTTNSGVVTAVFPATSAAPDINVVFQSVVQIDGKSGTEDSTALILSFDVDPASLIADNITVAGAKKGALTGSGTTRSLVISKITVSDGGTISVTITNPTGYAISGSPKTTVVYRAPYIGMTYQGGIIAYIFKPGDSGYVVGQTHGLIAATADQGDGIIWAIPAKQATFVGGTSIEFGSGLANTKAIIAKNGAGTTYAAGLARAYTGGGYTDWYLPSRDELKKLHLNRVAIGGFSNNNYWSSSEYHPSNPNLAHSQDFGYVGESTGGSFKDLPYHVRPVRDF